MAYNINLGAWGSVFAVPSSVVDAGLKLSSDVQLKVLLYILRHNSEALTDELISKALNIHTDDISDAIEYWCQKGLLIKTDNVISVPETVSTEVSSDNSAVQVSTPVQNTAESAPITMSETKTEQTTRLISRPQKPEQSYVRQRIKGDQNLALLMNETSQMLGKLLSQPDMATLIMLHDTDGLPVEVILMLIQHCVQIGKGNMRYIEKTGISWAASGIDTISLAEEKIKSYSESTSAWNTVAAVFGMRIGGTPTQKQLEFADRWINIWHFSEDMLRLAYERCVDAKGEVKLSYINGILNKWNENSLKKVDDVLRYDSQTSQKRKIKQSSDATQSASYDIDAYESKSIFDD